MMFTELLAVKTKEQAKLLPGESVIGDPTKSFESLNLIISASIGFLTVIAGIWFLYLLITGAIGIMSAGGNKGQLEESKSKLSTAVIGLIVVIAAIFIADLIGTFLGLDIRNPADVIKALVP